MGLDMYLHRDTYVKNWDYKGPENHITVSVSGGNTSHIDPTQITGITEEVAYWRKANHIHDWFVRNVQGGIDECQRAYVSREQLSELLRICKDVYSHRSASLSKQLLPTTAGFFFGGTDIDEYYYDTIKYTIEVLEKLDLDSESDLFEPDYYYQASW